jgi:glycosyltransferase involved in cell wall biosynthesis
MTRRSADARPPVVSDAAQAAPTSARVMVVGAGWRFTSGISYYTCRLANAFAESTPTSALLMRQLVPTRLYPGRNRVGKSVNDLRYASGVPVYDGVDWFWGKSMRDARRFITENRPDVLVLQWWTGAVLHSYLRLASLVRSYGGQVVIEWHEVQDTGEARLPGVTRYVVMAMKRLLRNVDGHLVHSEYDLALLRGTYDLPGERVAIAPHGPYDHHRGQEIDSAPVERVGDFVFLYFGIIRPYKGVEDLVAAFDLLPASVREKSRLVIVGETWEGWTLPLDAVAASPNADRITVVNRYVEDSEVAEHFAAADAVVLPYRRSSSSGPLHIAMSSGLPVIVSSVGGLVEAAGDYAGATFVPPADPAALAEKLAELPASRGARFTDPHSWDHTVDAYSHLFARIGAPPMTLRPAPASSDSASPEAQASAADALAANTPSV